MLLEDIVDQIIINANGGVVTDDDKFDNKAIEAKIPAWRQQAFLDVYNGTKYRAGNTFIDSSNYWQVSLTLDPSIQVDGADFKIFEIEPPVKLSPLYNGFIFFGDEKTGQNFTQIRTPAAFDTMKRANQIDANEVYYIPTGKKVKTWGNTQLTAAYADYIPYDVMNCSNFNPVTDDYPISGDVLKVMYDIAQIEIKQQAMTPSDTLNDSTNPLNKQAKS